MRKFLIPALLVAGVATASAETVTDTFDGGTNIGHWTFGVTVPDTIEDSGGNPGAWLRNRGIVSFAPILRNEFGSDSPFVGDYRARQVTSISIDARTDFASFGAAGREFSLLLRDTKGTFDVDDDDYAYYVGEIVPQPGQGWVSYNFDIPSQSNDAVPAGWRGGWVGDGENFRPGVEWRDVISSVDQVEFWWLNPSFFALIQDWDVGVDNVSIDFVPEPGTLSMLGLAGLAALRRRR